MASSMIVKLVSMVVMCMVLGAPVAQAITCGQVSTSLTPCINYVKGGEVVPPPACCRGITSLNGKANTTADRQAACKCVKQLAGAISGINPNLAAGLPGKCGVNVPYEISPNTNCATLK